MLARRHEKDKAARAAFLVAPEWASARLVPQGAAVDDRIRPHMRDPRTWRELDRGLLDNVTRQWVRAYPGASPHTGFRRPDPQPAMRPAEVEPRRPADHSAAAR